MASICPRVIDVYSGASELHQVRAIFYTSNWDAPTRPTSKPHATSRPHPRKRALDEGTSAFLTAHAPLTAHAQQYASDPRGSGPILAAVNWVQGSLLGNLATAVAVVAVAVVGFMMLSGRMNWRHGITVIVGCFVLFGAATIVAGIQTAARMAG